MKQKLSFSNRILIGFTLFSLFFGAGNLIFPPFLGYEAGDNLWPAAAGFILSAVLLPVLGVAAIASSGGLDKLAGRVHPKFSLVFTVLIYLSIGPCLAIPRTAGTSYEMVLLPFLGEYAGRGSQLVYTLLFFLAAAFFALRPEKLTDRLGKVTAPALLIMIALLFAGCVCWPVGQPGEPLNQYGKAPVLHGFLEGYQTMDTMAALNFGIVIALNIRARGIKADGAVVRETIFGGITAGAVLGGVYAVLAYMGNMAGREIENGRNGVEILTWIASSLYGNTGLMLLGIIFFVACLNVCIGLISSCSQYFSRLCPAFSYRKWVVLFTVVSMVIANAGLDQVLAFSVPVIETIYPVAIVLIVLAFLNRFLGGYALVYPFCTGFTAAASLLQTFGKLFPDSFLAAAAAFLPGAQDGFGWVLPAALAVWLGIVCSRERSKKRAGR